MDFDYKPEKVLTATLEVDDIGNCAIEAINDLEEYYYLVIKTELGNSEIFKYGPIVPGSGDLPESMSIEYSQMEYNMKKIKKIIFAFLNNYKADIVEAKVVDRDEALDNCVDITTYLR